MSRFTDARGKKRHILYRMPDSVFLWNDDAKGKARVSSVAASVPVVPDLPSLMSSSSVEVKVADLIEMGVCRF